MSGELTIHSSGARALATSTAQSMVLGGVTPLGPADDGPLANALGEVVRKARELAGPEPTDRELRHHWQRRRPLSLRDYKEAVSNFYKLDRAIQNDNYVENDSPELRIFIRQVYQRDLHTPDVQGYGTYLAALHPTLAAIVGQLDPTASPIVLAEAERQMHTLIVGSSGAGKSELLKLMVHHYVRHETDAVVVLDPQGKLVQEIARWQEFSGGGADRLVYLDASLDAEQVPALNPIIKRAGATEDDLASTARQIADALAYLGGEGEGLTNYMQRLATNCIRVLLGRGGTLLDLRQALLSKNDTWLATAGRAHPDPIVREHFEHEFSADNWRSARQGLAGRLGDALGFPTFRRMMTAEGGLDLEPLCNAGRVILVNCGSAHEANVALGRLMIAQLAAIGKRRIFRNETDARVAGRRIHVFVDEATMLMAPPVFTILDQMRKAGIHLTMVQQALGAGLSSSQVNGLVTNTAVKMVGRSDRLGQVLKQLDWNMAEVPTLSVGQFLTRWGKGSEPLMIDTRAADYLADNTNAMDDDEWQDVAENQLKRFYAAGTQPAGVAPAPADDAGARSSPGSEQLPGIQKTPSRSRTGFSVPPPPDKRWKD